MRLLVERGSSLEAPDNRKATPLFLAAESGHVDVAVYLVSKGARLDAADCEGQTPMDVAGNHGQLRELLQQTQKGEISVEEFLSAA